MGENILKRKKLEPAVISGDTGRDGGDGNEPSLNTYCVLGIL